MSHFQVEDRPVILSLPDPPRIAVVGTTGSGKTTLARRLAELLKAPHVELDALHWGPGWTPVCTEEFRARIAGALAGRRWVCDGNYSKGRDLTLARANTLVWLDYPLWLVMARLLRRTVRRTVTGEALWAGNREGVRNFLSTESVLLWALKTHGQGKREYSALAAEPAYGHITVVRLRSHRETQDWLRGIPASGAAGLD